MANMEQGIGLSGGAGKVISPLGRRIASSHETWNIRCDPTSGSVYIPQGYRYKAITPAIQPTRRVTRAAMRPLYDFSKYELVEHINTDSLLDATIEASLSPDLTVCHINTGYQRISPSPTTPKPCSLPPFHCMFDP